MTRASTPADPDHLVVVSGCSGGGKSALLDQMARRGYGVRPEPGRQIVREQVAVGGDALPWGDVRGFVEACVARGRYFHATAAASGGLVLFDRSIVDAVAGLARLGLSVPARLREAVQRCRYARTVFVAPPWEELFENDRERRHSFAEAVAEYEWLLDSYPAQGYQIELIPKVGIDERAEFLERRLGRWPAASGRSASQSRAGMRCRIRRAAPVDRVAAVDCVHAAFAGFIPQIGKPPAPMLADYGALIAAGHVHLLELGGAVAGVLVSEPKPDHLFVDVLAVRPDSQRQGLGRRLMKFAEREARRAGHGEVRLYTHEVMRGALALYRALNYEETDRRLEDGYARVYLRRIVPPAA